MKPSREPKNTKRRAIRAKKQRIYRHNKSVGMHSDFMLKGVNDYDEDERVQLNPKDYIEEPIRVVCADVIPPPSPILNTKGLVEGLLKIFS